MKEENTNPLTEKQGRRSFLKKSALAGLGLTALAGTGSVLLAKEGNEETSKSNSFNLFKKEYNSIDECYEIRPDYSRMDQKNTTYNRGGWDKEHENYLMSLIGKAEAMFPNPMTGQAGYSEVDRILAKAVGVGFEVGTGMSVFGQRSGGPMNDWKYFGDTNVAKKKFNFKSPEEASKYVKRASNFLGADDVGIAPFDERWIYNKWYDFSPKLLRQEEPIHEEAKFPFKVKSVIVTIHEMDYDGFKSPGYLMDATVKKGYSEMAEVTHKIAAFLNGLGYKAIPAGNDTGMSVPLALQAGLGELSRMGIAIHPKYGSRIRIAKVYTDMEIEPDKPITFGVQEFCRKCKKCAENCPSNAISLETEPTFAPGHESVGNNPGVKKWYQNDKKCYEHFAKIGAGCSICAAVCPYNKLDTWVHDVSKIATSIPVGRDIARQLDDAFGYGQITSENAEKFWDKDII